MSAAGVTAPRVGLIPSLDGLRAVSILFVFWAHAGLPGGVRGGTGVTIFFFLSGYLITTLMRVEKDRSGRISLKDFYLRRLFRIFPPMYFAIALGLLLSVAGLLAATPTLGGVASSLFFFTNYWNIFANGVGVPDGLGVLWSLSVEEHYYLVFPLVYLLLQRFLPSPRRQIMLLAAICLVVVAWRTWLFIGEGVDAPRVYYATDTRIDSILFGAMLAIGMNPVYGEIRTKRDWQLPVAAAAAFVVFLLVSFGPATINYTVGYTLQGIALMPIFAYLILAPRSWAGRILNWRPLVFVGVLSYTMYLVHSQFLHAVRYVTDIPVPAEAAIAAVLTFVVSWAVYRFIEKPMARFRKRLSNSGEAVDRLTPRVGENETSAKLVG
ncbi:acyltransferase [Microbacterium oryzae]|uniref:acyltransferase family protein n=1 Tax=Microbacterium oryzae TaxID=743009 RepID=UPI0025AEFB93|nr:acyltransferase [Microbacterium oryzae]MDN3310451.1 acyltransferase [Microbacterium oryzae]